MKRFPSSTETAAFLITLRYLGQVAWPVLKNKTSDAIKS